MLNMTTLSYVWATLRDILPKCIIWRGKGNNNFMVEKNLTITTSALWSRSTSIVICPVDNIQLIAYNENNTLSLGIPFTTHERSVAMRETSAKHKARHILGNN